MLTTEDIQNLLEGMTENFSTKGDLDERFENSLKAQQATFATREEMDQKFEGLRSDFSDLQISVDGFAKKADAYFQEMVVLTHQVRRLEKWVHQIAKATNVQLEI